MSQKKLLLVKLGRVHQVTVLSFLAQDMAEPGSGSDRSRHNSGNSDAGSGRSKSPNVEDFCLNYNENNTKRRSKKGLISSLPHVKARNIYLLK